MMRPRVLPPVAYLACLHCPLDNATVMALLGSEKDLAVYSGEDVVVAHVAIVRAREEVCEAERRRKGMCWDGVGNGADSFDSVGAWVGQGGEDGLTAQTCW